LAETLAWETGIRVSAETVRRGLHRLGWRWRRPRPTVGPTDPDYDTKLEQIQQLLKDLPQDETAVFQDEVDVHLNPKIGSCWMPRGQQATISTPGNNEKRHVAGSVHWRTGGLFVSPPERRRDGQLFIAHLNDLRRRLRAYRRIHVICDNASFHRSRAVWSYLSGCGDRIQLHFLPSMRQRLIRLSEFGGTSTKPSHAITVAVTLTNYSSKRPNGSKALGITFTLR
jgi:putative transposase